MKPRTPAQATLVSPAQGSTLPAIASFTFNAPGAVCNIAVGTTLGNPNLQWFGNLPCGNVTISNINTLPANGGPVYVRVFTVYGATSLQEDFTFTGPAVVASPLPQPSVSTSPSSSPSPVPNTIGLGLNPDMSGFVPFPTNDPWNTDVSGYPLAVNPSPSASPSLLGQLYLSVTGGNLSPAFGTTWAGGPNGIPYYTVPGTQPLVPVPFVAYAFESDPGPYPLPSTSTSIEYASPAPGDAHVIVIDKDNKVSYELWGASYSASSGWSAANGAKWDLINNTTRPLGWTSANAAGLPEYPGLVRYDEVVTRGVIPHALAFTIQLSQQGFIAPARHASGSCGSNPATTNHSCMPMGARWRLKASYCSAYSKEVQIICTALKKYGMFLIDNGPNWQMLGAPDPRWSDTNLGDLKLIPSSAMEMVQTGPITNL